MALVIDRGLLGQIWCFGLVGVAGFAVNAGLVEILARFIGPVMAQIIAFPVAATVTWWLNRRYTFGASERTLLSEWLRYVLANSVGWLANNGVFLLVVFAFPIAYANPSIAVAAGSVAGMVFNFIGTRRIVFPPRRNNEDNQ